jgi:ABC-type sulfate transport system permease component
MYKVMLMKKLRTIIATALTAVLLALPLAAPAAVHAQSSFDNSKSAVCQGIEGAGGDTCGNGGNTINHIIQVALNILSIIVGIAAVIMVIVGGLRFVISAGDSAAVSSARNTVLYALVGLVFVAIAQLLVVFVLSRIK